MRCDDGNVGVNCSQPELKGTVQMRTRIDERKETSERCSTMYSHVLIPKTKLPSELLTLCFLPPESKFENDFGVRFSRKPRRTTTRTRHPPLSSDATHTAMTAPSGAITTITTPASLADPQEVISGLPDHLVVTHILRSGYFDDPADLARLPAVSRAMRDAVAGTGLRFEELSEHEAATDLGCLNALQRRQRGGRLQYQERLCQAAARSGQLEKLKSLRADGCPWNEWV